MDLPIETEFSKKGETKFIPYECKFTKFRVELYREVWKEREGSKFRALHILIQLGENKIVLSGGSFWDVLHQAAKHLTLLTEPTEET